VHGSSTRRCAGTRGRDSSATPSRLGLVFRFVPFLVGFGANPGALLGKHRLDVLVGVEVDLAPVLGPQAVVGSFIVEETKPLNPAWRRRSTIVPSSSTDLSKSSEYCSEGDEEVLASRAVVPHRTLRTPAREPLPGEIGVGRLLDAQFAKARVEEIELVLPTEQQCVEAVHLIARPAEVPVSPGEG